MKKIIKYLTVAATCVLILSLSSCNKPNKPEDTKQKFLQTVAGVTDGVYAEDGALFTSDGKYKLQFDETSESYVIARYLGNEEDIAIPGNIGEYEVTAIGPYAFSGVECQSVTVPKNVEEIREHAFSNSYSDLSTLCPVINIRPTEKVKACTAVRVVFEEGSRLSRIGECAFSYCKQLEEIALPDGVKAIGQSAFSNCSALTSIDLPPLILDVSDNLFSGCKSLKSVTIPDGATRIGVGAFQECTLLEEVVIPSSVTLVLSSAFDGCSALTFVTLPPQITEIADSLFLSCESLKSVTIPEGVSRIGNNAFQNCKLLEEVLIPASVSSIGNYAFYYCSSLKQIGLGYGLKEIGERAFTGSGIESIAIPESVSAIGNYAFGECTNVKSIVVDENNAVYASIGNCLVQKDTKTLIKGSNNSVLSSDDVGIEVIGYGAFFCCEGLEKIVIPSSVIRIESFAFGGCTELKQVVLSNGLKSINGNAFSGCDKLVYNEYENGRYLGSEDTPYFALISVISRKVTELDMHVGTRIFCTSVLGECKELEKVIIRANLKVIPENMFSGMSNLKTVVISEGITEIGARAFMNCHALENINIPSTVKTIGDHAFSSCSSINTLTIPQGVETIGANAFMDCLGLVSVDLPDSLVSIGVGAFATCKALDSIVFNGSKSQWKSVQKGTGWVADIGGYSIRYTQSDTDSTAPS